MGVTSFPIVHVGTAVQVKPGRQEWQGSPRMMPSSSMCSRLREGFGDTGKTGDGGGRESRPNPRLMASATGWGRSDWGPGRIEEERLGLGTARVAVSFTARLVALSVPFAVPAIHRDGFCHMASTT